MFRNSPSKPTTAVVLAAQGDGPALTVRDLSGGARAIWIGGKANYALTGYMGLTHSAAIGLQAATGR